MTRQEEDDEPTRRDLGADMPAPTYEHAPATMEMRPSPFHPLASGTPTTPGMPSPFALDPVITAMPAGVAIVPPRIVGAKRSDGSPAPAPFAGVGMPSRSGATDVIVGSPEGDMAGPTDPDGHPLPDSWEGPGSASLEGPHWIDSGPTDVSAVPRTGVTPQIVGAQRSDGSPTPAPFAGVGMPSRSGATHGIVHSRVTPQVPPPDAPKIEVSQSLMLESEEVKTAVRAAKAKTRAAKRRRHHVPQEGPGAAAPTYQMLPALKRKQVKEGSDWPLIIGLLTLALVIAALIAVGAYFATRSIG